MATIALQSGLNRVQTRVDLRSRSVPRRIAFLLFSKHLEQTACVGLFHELRVVKERSSVRLGGRILIAFYRILFAIASKKH